MKRAGLPAGPRRAFWFALSFFLILLSMFSMRMAAQNDTQSSGISPRHRESANRLYKEGQAAEQREDWDTAYFDYKAAFEKNAKDLRFRTSMFRVRVTASSAHVSKGRQLEAAGDDQGALTEFLRAVQVDPGNEAAVQAISALRRRQVQGTPAAPPVTPDQANLQRELDSMGAPVELKPVSSEPLTLHMSEDCKVIYQAIGRAAGINVLFDPDYNSKRIQVDLTNSTLMDALRIVGVISNTFWRPITANTIFVAQNTRSKRTELDDTAVQTFYLTNAWQQNDLNDVQTALRNVLTNIKVYGLASQNALVVRGTPDELLLAQKLINDLDKARPEVVVDIAVMEVSKNWERNIGLSWPASAGVALQNPSSSSSSTTCPTGSTTCTPSSTSSSGNLTLYNLAHLNSNDFAVTVGTATANLLLTDSHTRILQNPRLRATDMQKATMKVGERIPIATGSYQTGAATALVSSLVNTQFQYLDVGVNIEITPTVHFDRDVTLKMKIEVTAQAGSSTISGVTEPIIAQKSTEEVVRLREGEANIVSGILNQQDQVSWSGIPGLSSIPLLKYLFGSKDHTVTDDEVVFLMVPHVVRGQDVTPENLRAVDTGAGQSVELRRIAMEGPGVNSAPQVQPVVTQSTPPHAPGQPNVASVPGESAAASAPAALAQLKASAGGNTSTMPQPNPQPVPSAGPPPGAQPGMQAVPQMAPSPAPQSVPQPGMPAVPQAASPSPGAQPGAPAAIAPVNPAAAAPGAAPGPGRAPTPGAQPAPPPAKAGAAPLRFMLNSPGPVANGSTFQIPVVIVGAADIASVPLQIKYDPEKLSLSNVSAGDFLSRDGQAVALVHRDDGPGMITVNASRPPGAAGVSGAGVVCMLSFQAKAPGDTQVTITRPGAVSSAQKPVAATGSDVKVTVK
jgi:general secretion pathway protein D